jgi:dTDP-4-amino-4,6-dideoxygalactose transaminase
MALLINEIKRQNELIAADLSEAIQRVLTRGWYILGPEVEAFENEFAAYCGAKNCVAVANGTDALELALKALDIPAGAPVVTVANAGMYATTAIYQAGGRPVFVDVSADSMTMDPASLRSCLTSNVAAVIVTHLYGQMAAMPEIHEITQAAGIPLIEDCAQAHGAKMNGRRAGAWGTVGCFSFYPTKNLGALGDGGAVITSDVDVATRIRRLRQYGWASKYQSDVPGGRNSRLDEMQAAILRTKLPHLDKWNERRRQIATRYSRAFADLPMTFPSKPAAESYVAHLYVVRTPHRDHLRNILNEASISTDVHYPIPDYKQRSIAPKLAEAPYLPVTESSCNEVLTLPCFPEMTDKEIEHVIESVHVANLDRTVATWARI